MNLESVAVHQSAEVNRDMTGPYKILFLEDNPDDVELMQHELRLAGLNFVYRQVSRKKDILDEVDDFQPDVILVDYVLPSFNGIEAFRLVRQMHKYIPFILVTGALSEKVALEFLKEGVDDFILKSSFKRLPAAILGAIKKQQGERERSRIAIELKKSHQELKLLLDRQAHALEEERTTIARDLHDDLGQVLTALKIDVSMLRKQVLSGKSLAGVDQEFLSITSLIDQITHSVKRISAGLRPEVLDHLGLLEAIQCQALEFEKRNNVSCQTFLPKGLLDLDKDFSITVYRIVQEALTNVARHAKATKVQIHLDVADNAFFLTITDNGVGISNSEVENSSSLGIIGLRERIHSLGGRFSISGSARDGTAISVVLPLNNSLIETIEK